LTQALDVIVVFKAEAMGVVIGACIKYLGPRGPFLNLGLGDWHTQVEINAAFYTDTARYVSPLVSSWIPGVFYTYFYNHVHRLRLEKLLYLELSRSPNGFFKVLLDPGGGFRIETAVTKPFRK
jgi:hypothetical protein